MVEPLVEPCVLRLSTPRPALLTAIVNGHGAFWSFAQMLLALQILGIFVGTNQVVGGMCFVSVRIIYVNIGGLMFWRLLLEYHSYDGFDDMIIWSYVLHWSVLQKISIQCASMCSSLFPQVMGDSFWVPKSRLKPRYQRRGAIMGIYSYPPLLGGSSYLVEWLITMVIVSPLSGVVPLRNGLHGL